MMRLFINALAASAGGGLTYIRNVLPHMAAQPDLQVTIALASGLRGQIPEHANIEQLELDSSIKRRFWFEQTELPNVIRRCGSEVLLSAGNFAVRRAGVPQILLSRNSLYTSVDFCRDLRNRREYRMLLETQVRAFLARKSVSWADLTIAPSEAFAAELRRWTGKPVQALYHGFDRETFFADSSLLPSPIAEKLELAGDAIRLLFVSHYNYYRNFETLIRALPLLRQMIPNQAVRLFLTCKLRAGENPGAYNPDSAMRLINELGVEEMVIQLGAIPYQKLHQVYAAADIYVSPAYAETFAHPMVEAMSCGLPVVASDIAVHREICRDAAVYFERFSANELAERIAQLWQSEERFAQLKSAAKLRMNVFSWSEHVRELLSRAAELASRTQSTRVALM